MKLNIELDEDVLRKAVDCAWQELLQPNYHSAPAGLKVIREQVARYLDDLDLSSIIREYGQQMLPKIIEDEVATAIRAAVKREIAAAKKRGELA